jgi:hypothetical protein
LTPGELHEVTDPGKNRASARGANDGDPASAPELDQAFVTEHPQRPEHGVAVHVQHRREVPGGRKPLSGAYLALGDGPADFRAHLLVERQRVLPVNLDTSHDDNQTSTMKGDSRASTIKPVAPLAVPAAEGDAEAQVLIKEARERARRRRRRLALALAAGLVGVLVVTASVFAVVRNSSGGAAKGRADRSRQPAATAGPVAQPRFFADTQGSGEGNGPLQVRAAGTGQLVWQDPRATTADGVTGLSAVGPGGFIVGLNGARACTTRLYRVRLNAGGRAGVLAPFGPTLPGELWSLAVGDGGRVIGYAISGCSKSASGYLGVLNATTGKTRQWGDMNLGGVSAGNLILQGSLSMSANGRLLGFAAFAGFAAPNDDGRIAEQSVRVLSTDAPAGSVAERSRVVYRKAAPRAAGGFDVAAASVSSAGTSVYVCLQSVTRTQATAKIIKSGTIPGRPARTVATFTARGLARGSTPPASCSSMTLDTSGQFLLVPYSLRYLPRPSTEMVQGIAKINLATKAISTVPAEMPGSGGISEESGMSIVAW